MSLGSTATTPFRTGMPRAVLPGRWYATESTLSRYARGGARRHGADTESAAEDGNEKHAPPSCSPTHEGVTLTGSGSCAWRMRLFAEILALVRGCRHPPTLLVSPTCDGPDRHRQVCPGSTTGPRAGLDNRMGADRRGSRGTCCGGPARRRPGIRADRRVEAGTGAGH